MAVTATTAGTARKPHAEQGARLRSSPGSGTANALADGQILLIETAAPAWIPAFAGAGAIVWARGGWVCQATVLARELRIPAVFGVGDLAHLQLDGRWLELTGDGSVPCRDHPILLHEGLTGTAANPVKEIA